MKPHVMADHVVCKRNKYFATPQKSSLIRLLRSNNFDSNNLERFSDFFCPQLSGGPPHDKS